jgi:hypothetical protein
VLALSRVASRPYQAGGLAWAVRLPPEELPLGLPLLDELDPLLLELALLGDDPVRSAVDEVAAPGFE